jgi:hypothetical protein
MSQKINAIVFSQDRPAQLKLFLDSVNKNASDVFDLNVIVSHTSEEFDKGYGKLVHNPKFNGVNFFFAESDFKEQVLRLLNTDGQYSCFFLDDDIIYRGVKLEEITNQLELDDDVACFSLRLGENTTNCYTLGTNNVLHDMEYSGDIMKWDWSLHYLDFGYPFAMDGHIFRRTDIYKLVKKSKFTGVEELEMALFDFAEMFPRNKMVSYKHSALVGVPIGRLQESLDNEMTIALRESRARLMRLEMNNQLLDGSFINLEEIDFSKVNGCHQDLNLGVELKKQEENE